MTIGTLRDVAAQRTRENDAPAVRGRAAVRRLIDKANARGWDNTRMGKEAGISRTSIPKYLSGERSQMGIGSAALLADALDVSLDWVAGRNVPDDLHRAFRREADDSRELRQALERSGGCYDIAVIAAARRSGLKLDEEGWGDFLDDLQRSYREARERAESGSRVRGRNAK